MAFVLFLYAAAVSAIISLAAVIPFAYTHTLTRHSPVQWMDFVRKSQVIVRATRTKTCTTVLYFAFWHLPFFAGSLVWSAITIIISLSHYTKVLVVTMCINK